MIDSLIQTFLSSIDENDRKSTEVDVEEILSTIHGLVRTSGIFNSTEDLRHKLQENHHKVLQKISHHCEKIVAGLSAGKTHLSAQKGDELSDLLQPFSQPTNMDDKDQMWPIIKMIKSVAPDGLS